MRRDGSANALSKVTRHDAKSTGLPCSLRASHPSRHFSLGDLKPIGGSTTGEQIERACNQSRPPRLVTRSEARAVVPMEVFIEQNVVSPVGVLLKLFGASIDRSLATRIREKMLDNLRAISFATSNNVRCFPEPVGHSTLKSSP
jgi:hypothetical protein